jgi:hypothetical protein
MEATLASAFISSSIARVQLAVAAKMLRMNADQAANAVKIIEAAQDNIDRLANVAEGIGGNLDISV